MPLRLFHWLLAVSLLGSWLTGEGGYDYRPLHMWLGYWILGLIAFRLVWGVVGPRHARFASFAPSPRALVTYLRGLRSGRTPASVGHNPLGALSVYAMLALVGLQAVSGLFVYDDIMYGGPYNALVSEQLADRMAALHHQLIDVIVALVVVHLAAVAWYVWRKKQPLVRAMLTGRKPASTVPAAAAISGSRLARAAVVAVACGAFVYWLVAVAPAG